MLRAAPLLVLLLAASCADLTDVPPPPVPLSLLQGALGGGLGEERSAPAGTETLRLLRAAPPGALLTLHVPDVAAAARGLRETALRRVLESREVRQLLAALPGAVAARLGPWAGAPDAPRREDAAGGVPAPTDLLSSLQGELVVCLEDLPQGDGAGPGIPRLLLLAGIGGFEDAAEKLVDGVGAMAALDRGVKVERGSVAGSPFVRVVLKRPADLILEMAVHKGALLAGLGRETVPEAIERAERNGPSAATDPGLQRCVEACGDPRDAFRLHVDVAAWLRRLGPRIPEPTRLALAQLGLDRVRGLAFALAPDGACLVTKTFLDSPGGEDALTRLLARHAVDRRFLDLLPSDTIAFSVFALDGRAVLRTLRTALPSGELAGLERAIADLGRAGIDLEGDVFEAFGPRCALVTVPTERAAAQGLDALWRRFQGLVLVAEVQDPERARTVLGRLPPGTGAVRRATRTVGRHTVQDYQFVAGQLPSGFSVSYALTDAHLFVALSEDALTRMLSVDPGRFGTRFREAVKAAPEAVVSLSYEDVRPGVETLLGLLAPAAHAEAAGEDGADPAALASVLRGLEPTLSYTVAGASGVLVVTRSPTAGLGSMSGPLSLLVVASLAIPNLTQARMQGNESSAILTLRAIEAAQAAFRGRRLIDADDDGEGEYAFLDELAGDAPLRSGRAAPRNLAPVPGLVRNADGTYERNGYLFEVHLPADDGSPVGGRDARLRRQVDGDLAETICVTVAWPVGRDRTGRKCFLMDAAGAIHACGDGAYEGGRPPPADVLSSQARNIASAPLPAGQPGRDGCAWERVR